MSGVVLRVFARGRSELWDELTDAEREVAEALVAGERIDDIAAKRGTQPSTVARQAHNIYRKVGVTGRLELAGRLLA